VEEQSLYEFDEFRLDAAKRLLLKNEERVPLTPRVFDTLLYLVRNPGRVIPKEELMRAIWPDRFVEENNLNQNISTLRRALGGNGGEDSYIITVPGRGYRFTASTDLAIGSVATSAVLPPEEKRARHSKLPALIVAIVALLFAAGTVFWRSQVPSSPGVRTIAVLPFKPLTAQYRDESFEMGMADSLIAKLGTLSDVTVRPLSSVLKYRGPEQNLFSAGRELDVETILEGYIQKAGNRIRVTARLVRVGDEKQLWTGQFDEELRDIFAVQDSISEKVATALALELSGEQKDLLAKRYTADPQAYEFYLKGRFLLNQSRHESIRKAIGFFEQAVEKDPNYALAYVSLADCYDRLPVTSDVPSRDAFPKAKEAVLKALKIDGDLAEAHTLLGWINIWYEWDWEGAENEFRRGLASNPNHAFTYMGLAHRLSDLGRQEEALVQVDRALSLDPITPMNGALKGHILYISRRYAEGIEHMRRSLEHQPNFWVGQLMLGKNYAGAGRTAEALEAFRKAKQFSGGSSEPISLMGYSHAVSGKRKEAESALLELATISEHKYVPPYNMAILNHGLGNSDEALRWLERAFEDRDVHMVFLGVEPKWDGLRTHARFVSLLKRMRLVF
jgi:DNA-binding winged helix-turn-helix (wHTH) protein/TolB-like protein/Flp pilus assembly protein TadD